MNYKIFVYILISMPLLLGLVSPDNDDIHEKIRRKIENLKFDHALNREYEVYCVPSLREVYMNNSFQKIWIDEQKKKDFIAILEKSGEEGLIPTDYHLKDIRELVAKKSEEAQANLDIILTDAYLLYISHMLSGKTNPVTLNAEWHVIKTDRNPVQYIEKLKTHSIQTIFTEVQPKNEAYKKLKRKLRYLKSQQKRAPIKNIGKGEVILAGSSDQRIPSIRNKLISLGDIKEYAVADSLYYDETLKAGVILFQKRYGLEAMGRIGNQTIEALNMSLEDKIRLVEINMERWRWMPLEFGDYYFLVNIANFELNVYKNNIVERTHKVIVGRTFRKTPVFGATMQYLVFNPTWTVPPGILKNDIIPEVRKNPGYLGSKNIFVYDKDGQRIDISTIDWNNKSVNSYTFRQEPGKTNALGAVKFMFPNPYHVYLHDTPSKELFEKTERAFSSGCIRVQDPLELARYVLNDPVQWSSEKIKKVIDENRIRTMVINNKPEVYLIYLTSWVDDNNRLHFRNDIYERDKAVYKALNEKPVYDLN